MPRPIYSPPKRPYLYLPDGWSDAWLAAKAGALSGGQARLLFLGDSVMAGVNASDWRNSIPETVRTSLEAAGYPTFARGFHAYGDGENAGGGGVNAPWSGLQNGVATTLFAQEGLGMVSFVGAGVQEAVPEGTGGIAAILGLEADALAAVCAEAAQGEVLEPANLNSPGQVVIAGHRGAVERGMAAAKQKGAKRAVMLPMSAPSHCSLMKPAAERLAERLGAIDIRKPVVPVVHNRFVEAFDDPARIRQALVEQLYNPVRWIETIECIAQTGVKRVIECGPGKVLAGLGKRIAPDVEFIALQDSAALLAAIG